MGRVISRNAEIDVGGKIITPMKLGDFGPKVGTVQATDGKAIYEISNQVTTYEKIEVDIAMTDDKREYDIMEDWWKSGAAKDVFVRLRNASGDVHQSFLLSACQCVPDALSGFDAKSKNYQDMKKYNMLPKSIEEIK